MRHAIVALPGHNREASLIAKGAGIRPTLAAVGAYPDGEIRVGLPRSIRGTRPVIVVPSGSDWNGLGAALMAVRAAAEFGTGPEIFMGMMPYARSDKASLGEPVSARLVAELFSAAGAASATIVAPHSTGSISGFGCPVNAIEPLPAMALAVCGGWRPDTVIAPDMGAVARASAVGEVLGGIPVAAISKRRLSNGRAIAVGIEGDVGREVLIVDDIASTGGTIAAAARLARKRGAERIVALVVHGTRAHNFDANLREAGIERLFVSDSAPIVKCRRVVTIPLIESVGRSLYRL